MAVTVLAVTADDVIQELYLDGVMVPASALLNASIFDVPDSVVLPSTTNVIAVLVKNTNGPDAGYGGLLASDTTGRIISDSTWKCSNVNSSGWMNVNFNDSSWKNAALLFNNSGSTIYQPIPGIRPEAWWIWNSEKSLDLYVYLRLRFS